MVPLFSPSGGIIDGRRLRSDEEYDEPAYHRPAEEHVHDQDRRQHVVVAKGRDHEWYEVKENQS